MSLDGTIRQVGKEDSMAVIKGDFKYFAFYESIDEMKKDRYLEERYLISVIVNQTHMNYQISSRKADGAIKLDNGLFANPVLTGNALSDDVHEYYSTIAPIEYQVGGISEGTEYQMTPLAKIIDDMFYGTLMIDFEIQDDLYKETHVKGELHQVSKIYIKLKRSENPVVKQEVYVDKKLYFSSDEEWEIGDHEIDVDIRFRDTTEIAVVLRDKEGNAVEKMIVEKFACPIFYKIINSNTEPSGTSIKKMENIRDIENLEITGDLMAQSVFIAVPNNNVEVVRVLDENNFNIKSIFTKYTTSIILGETSEQTSYLCYKSRELTIDDFKFIFELKEVVK